MCQIARVFERARRKRLGLPRQIGRDERLARGLLEAVIEVGRQRRDPTQTHEVSMNLIRREAPHLLRELLARPLLLVWVARSDGFVYERQRLVNDLLRLIREPRVPRRRAYDIGPGNLWREVVGAVADEKNVRHVRPQCCIWIWNVCRNVMVRFENWRRGRR
jgi:hypothetical protein